MRGLLPDRSLQRTVLEGGIEIHFAEEGAGVPLVFVHGGMGDWSSWAPQWPAFTPHYRCITYSRRYSQPNRNRPSGRDHSVVAEAQDLLQLLDGWCAEPAMLVGTSYGAYTALWVALAAPGRIRALALTEPPVMPLADEVPGGQLARLRFQQEVLQPATQAFNHGDSEAAVRLLTDGINGTGPGEAGTSEGRARRMRNAEAMHAVCRSTDAYPMPDRAALQSLEMPILLTHGERTLAVHRAIAQALSKRLPRAKAVQVADSGHGVHRDNPAAFNALLLAFLGES